MLDCAGGGSTRSEDDRSRVVQVAANGRRECKASRDRRQRRVIFGKISSNRLEMYRERREVVFRAWVNLRRFAGHQAAGGGREERRTADHQPIVRRQEQSAARAEGGAAPA